jgi:hypothetical protein
LVSHLADRLDDAWVVVSTLPANALAGRMFPEGSRFKGHLLLDVIYAGWPVRTFDEAVARVLSGFEMLFHRATGRCTR